MTDLAQFEHLYVLLSIQSLKDELGKLRVQLPKEQEKVSSLETKIFEIEVCIFTSFIIHI